MTDLQPVLPINELELAQGKENQNQNVHYKCQSKCTEE